METPEVSDPETKHLAEIGLTPEGVCRKTYAPDQIKAESDREFTFTISTGAVDRDNDTIKPDGWDLSNYRKNPVVLWAHRSDIPPVAKAVSITKSNGVLKARIQFPEEGVHELADTVHGLVKGGFLSATSVGFRPKKDKWSWNEERGGIDFQEQELLEFSVVPVPSNPEALMAQAKDFAGAAAAGIDLGPIRKALALADYVKDESHNGTWVPDPGHNVQVHIDGKALGTVKAGRRLSAKTEASLRNAHASAAKAVEHLQEALGDCEDEMEEGKSAVLMVTPSPQPAKFLVNPDDVKAAVVAAVSATVQSEVNRLRGRLD